MALLREKDRVDAPSNLDPIKAVSITKVYPNAYEALSNVSFGAQKNEVFCLLGPNGAGKSTMFDILTGRISSTSGHVQLLNCSSSKHSLAEMTGRVGICLQTNTLWDALTVYQHLKVYARLKRISGSDAREIIQFLLRSLHLEDKAHSRPQQLSGGTKRKLCLAIALIVAPEMLFLDEPSTAMNPISRRQAWSILKAIMKRTQGATILTTHFMEEAELVADKIGESVGLSAFMVFRNPNEREISTLR